MHIGIATSPVIVAGEAVPVAGGPWAFDITDLPVGPGIHRFEDLFVKGDTIAQTLARLPQPVNGVAAVTFGVGEFFGSDFATGNLTCINIPKWLTNIYGSGAGNMARTADGTYFGINPGSSTHKNDTTANQQECVVMKQGDGAAGFAGSNFRVCGTEQGHVFSGLVQYQNRGAVSLVGVEVDGWAGAGNTPATGETFGIGIQRCNGVIIDSCVADARRADGGRYGAGAFQLLDMAATPGRPVQIKDSTGQYGVASSGLALYQTIGVQTDNFTAAHFGTGHGTLSGSCINGERTSGTTHINPNLQADAAGGGVHLTHSNDSWAGEAGIAGSVDTQVPTVQAGTLTVGNPTNNDVINAGGRLTIQTWTTEMGAPETIRTAPVVTDAADQPIAFNWIH